MVIGCRVEVSPSERSSSLNSLFATLRCAILTRTSKPPLLREADTQTHNLKHKPTLVSNSMGWRACVMPALATHLSLLAHPHSTPLLCADASGVLRVNATSLHWQLLDSAEPTTVLDEMLLSR